MNKMKTKLFRLLVSRNAAIFTEYQKKQSTRRARLRPFGAFSALCYAVSLNVRWYLLRDRRIGRPSPPKPFSGGSEARADKRPTSAELAAQLEHYDAVSFDIFDTLVFRPFSAPKELFAIVGETLGIPDFVRLRVESEHTARLRRKKREGHMEITLSEIYDVLAEQVQIDKAAAAALELSEEYALCSANPYMRQVLERLVADGIPVYLVSDMYLSAQEMMHLLSGCGLSGWERLFVSSEYQASKFDGRLFEIVKDSLPPGTRLVHVGDHPRSDVEMAEAAGFSAVLYENVNTAGRPYRALPGCYGGIVNAFLHCGLAECSVAFELGYVYVGPLLASWCLYLQQTAVEHGLIPAISGQAETVRRVYARLFPDAPLGRQASDGTPMNGYFASLSPTVPLYAALRAGERFSVSDGVLTAGCDFAARELLQLCEGLTGLLLRCSPVVEEEIAGGAITFASQWRELYEKRPRLATLTAEAAAAPLRMALSDSEWLTQLQELSDF